MAERRFAIKVVGVDYVCDDCGTGIMQPHGDVAWMTNPVQFPHKCSHCGATKAFPERYPTLRYERMPELAATEPQP